MLFALFYIVAITILVLHFTGFLARRNLEWLVLVLAVAGLRHYLLPRGRMWPFWEQLRAILILMLGQTCRA